MFERAEVAYRKQQYAIRINGVIQPVAFGPNQAEEYRAAGCDVLKRERTVYHDDVGEWHELTTPSSAAVVAARETEEN